MKLPSFVFFVFLQTATAMFSYQSFTLVYDPGMKELFPADTWALRRVIPQLDAKEIPQITFILIGCPLRENAVNGYVLDVRLWCTSVDAITDEAYWKLCRRPPTPHIPKPYSTDAYTTFYDVSFSFSKKIIDQVTNTYREQRPSKHEYEFSVIKIEHDIEILRTKKTIHRIYTYLPGKGSYVQCENFMLGQQYLPATEIDTFRIEKYFKMTNQHKALSKFQRPEIVDENTRPEKPNTVMKKPWQSIFDYIPRHEYFVQYQLVPTDDFTDDPSRLATCTFLNLVPIWRTLEEPLALLNQYIRNVVRHLPINTVQIITKTSDVLKLPLKKSDKKKFLSEDYVYLDPYTEPMINVDLLGKGSTSNNEGRLSRFPAPKYIIKIITTRIYYTEDPPKNQEQSRFLSAKSSFRDDNLSDDEQPQEIPTVDAPQGHTTARQRIPKKSRNFYMAVVIHNELKRPIPLCDQNRIQGKGWQIPSDGTGRIYGCKLNKSLREWLGLPELGRLINLKNVPTVINRNGEIIRTRNVYDILNQPEQEAETSTVD